ncbi:MULTISPECIES: hypothetical protein [Pantoea]|uniref:hypothetical protein n=1 Tax=Pantoea TaxID=53335 RepID=UPI001F4D7A68|nr:MULTISPECIES: hypothetical protein [Pantoea]MCH9296352.1 hypothetical protein [Pantoea allii]
MPISAHDNRRITFLGQNSHGSDEAWLMRQTYINLMSQRGPVAVVVECPTIDLILFALKRHSLSSTAMAKFLASSTYWWMRSFEFRMLLMNLPPDADIFGIDMPLTTTLQRSYLSALNMLHNPVGSVLSELLKFDAINDEVLSSATPEQREKTMADKLCVILRNNYPEVIVICHNFHASRYSWLSYPSLCQRIIGLNQFNLSVKSLSVFSQDMKFIATPDGKTLNSYQISNACMHRGEYYRVKMISSYYRNEKQDALLMNIRTSLHFDEIIVYPSGNPITVENYHV